MHRRILSLLTTGSFLERVLLLGIAAVLTGVLAPFIQSKMVVKEYKERILFEAKVTRENEVTQARAHFLKELADPLWQFQLMALQVSYDYFESNEFSLTVNLYHKQSWTHLKKIRTIVGGGRWFMAESTYKRLDEFVDAYLLGEVDRKVVNLIDKGTHRDWEEFNLWLFTASKTRTDSLLIGIAEDFGLSPGFEN